MIPIDIDRIDDVIHGRVRLGIMTYLANADTADFNELKAALKTTQGNLSIHLTKLEEAGYISITKSFLGRKRNTRMRLTRAGRKAFADYLQVLSELVEKTAKGG
jgi:DNA-binding MarR family transcriptional regulator